MGWLLITWSAGAFALALSRVPYDDEWFSIELAFDTTPAQFWFALNDDVHPPWLALLDRAVGFVWRAPIALQSLRIAASALAIGLVARALSAPLQLPRWVFVLSACHPIVLFYAGSARWYPILLLAHALRLSAIWAQPGALPSRRGAAFLAGALLGTLAGYLDVLFLIHDGVWFAWRGRREGLRWRVLGALALAAIGCVILPLLASPLHGIPHDLGALWLPHWDLTSLATWSALGLAGETALPWPLALLGLACVLACAWSIASGLRAAISRAITAFIVSYGALWLLACGFGVWHPRYSLLLWLLCLALVWSQWPRVGRVAGSVFALGALHLSFGLALACSGFGFLKADLNRLYAADCSQLRAAERADALIVPYRRLAQLASRQCRLHVPMLSVPSIRLSQSSEEQLSGVQRALARPGDYWLLSLNTDSTMATTQERVRHLLQQHCSGAAATAFGEIPHPGLRPERSADYRRFTLQPFHCGQSHDTPLR